MADGSCSPPRLTPPDSAPPGDKEPDAPRKPRRPQPPPFQTGDSIVLERAGGDRNSSGSPLGSPAGSPRLSQEVLSQQIAESGWTSIVTFRADGESACMDGRACRPAPFFADGLSRQVLVLAGSSIPSSRGQALLLATSQLPRLAELPDFRR